MSSPPEEVEFPTLDGLTLRGLLYPARERGPAVIMTSRGQSPRFRVPLASGTFNANESGDIV